MGNLRDYDGKVEYSRRLERDFSWYETKASDEVIEAHLLESLMPTATCAYALRKTLCAFAAASRLRRHLAVTARFHPTDFLAP
jgi:hypothetical protein